MGESIARLRAEGVLPATSDGGHLPLDAPISVKEAVLPFDRFRTPEGVGVDTISWGSMLAEAGTELLLGKWWQLTVATVFMALLVTAFSLFTDAMRDALDPRLK